jgi:thiol-disulfide isomerase/thioredoxin
MDNNRKKNILMIFGVIIICVVCYFVYLNFLASANGSMEIGIKKNNLALNIEIPGVGESSVNLADLRGEIVVLDFMAPWCPPCKEQIKVLKLVNEVPNLKVLTINVDYRYSMEELIDFKEKEEITWFFGHSPEAGSKYETTTIPTIILIDAEGVIRYRGTYTTWNEFQNLIEKIGES